MIPCPYDSSHRKHWINKSFLRSKESCADYLRTIELQGHDENCSWEGYIAPKRCGCVKEEKVKEAPKKRSKPLSSSTFKGKR